MAIIEQLFQKACDLGVLNRLSFPEDLSTVPTDVKYHMLKEVLESTNNAIG